MKKSIFKSITICFILACTAISAVGCNNTNTDKTNATEPKAAETKAIENTTENITTGTTNMQYTKEYTYKGDKICIADFQSIEDNFFMYISEQEKYKGFSVDIYETDELTEDLLQNRTKHNRLIIERLIGIVADTECNGVILSTVDKDYNYISYKHKADNVSYEVGDLVLTYAVYSPYTDFTDDVTDRYEFNLTEI